jgi:hypothetical protein
MFGLSVNGLSVFLTIFFDIAVPFHFCGGAALKSSQGRLTGSNQGRSI